MRRITVKPGEGRSVPLKQITGAKGLMPAKGITTTYTPYIHRLIEDGDLERVPAQAAATAQPAAAPATADAPAPAVAPGAPVTPTAPAAPTK